MHYDRKKNQDKKFIFFLIGTIFISQQIYAGNCWRIKNHDQKALCESQYENKKNCWKIKSHDLKAFCEKVSYGKNNCWKIKNKNMKAMCESSY